MNPPDSHQGRLRANAVKAKNVAVAIVAIAKMTSIERRFM
jgi:hypothetical protein